MDVVSRDDLAALMSVSGERCVSIFLPTHRVGPDSRSVAQEDVIRLKNLLREAENRLKDAGASAGDADALLEAPRALLEDAVFWQYQADGLAVFVAPGVFRTYRVPLRPEELVVVAGRFHVKPLCMLLAGAGLGYVLALSQNAVRLLEVRRESANEVDLTTAPHSLQEALRFDEREKQLQFHTGSPPRPGGRRAALFHGQGVGSDDAKDRVLRFCQQVDRGLAPLLRGSSTPLVLAAVEYVASIYRQANTHPHLVDEIVAGNPESLNAGELHARAWPLMEPYFLRSRQAAAARFGELVATARTTHDLGAALAAAQDGRIDVLFVPLGVQSWGTFDPATQQVSVRETRQAGDEDLLNLATARTILTGGTVYTVHPEEMPAEGRVAALLRY